ncbi:MAG: phosphoribosylformylglycinamidine synthase subunit PurL [Bacteroidota bacterium]|nr:phosphoribosylformylglycinamidine synthase subunit PurL [Candidatus Kapabacteria bacterium]MCS7303239.1 phosphoribosylformylglycinamidine synthase subunit PurL [Candidatus Kapabacteria bacterium]MDW8074895.1 phosphoribosylformylglycinamidine synthase subunit PurL [Bacteroidota bacterium]
MESLQIARTDIGLRSEIPVSEALAIELGLTADEYARIIELLGRTPTYTELGMFSVMWSEHCSYKNSLLMLKTLPRSGGRLLVEAGKENAGLVDVGSGYAVAFKIESHNHPSAVEPYQGAATGVGGILRDIFTMGARPIAALNSLRFGDPTHRRTVYLVRGVVRGIGDYGNSFGVPTIGGEVYFDACYNDNPLVNAMAVGIVRTDRIVSSVARGVGNPVMIMGSSTGRDGIHGASLLASREFDEQSADMRPTVQVGDPFAEKLLLEAALELIEAGCVVGMQDMGAAGITCSTSEMSAKGNVGMDIDLDAVPLREADMSAYEILLSESQERMLVVIKQGKEELARAICRKWDVPLTQIGVVTDTGLLRIWHRGECVACIPASALVVGGGAPVYERAWKEAEYLAATRAFDQQAFEQAHQHHSLAALLEALLARPTIASKRWVYEQYDRHVGTNTIERSADAAIVRLKELPGKALALTTDCNSRYVYLNPRRGAMIAVAEAARNCVCAGAEPVAITNCLNFGNPYDPEVYWQFREAVLGMGEMCRLLGTPVTGGNVSFYNESQNHAIYPTPTIGMLGIIEALEHITPSGFQREGDVVYLLGWQSDRLDGSELVLMLSGHLQGDAPPFDPECEVRLQRTLLTAIRKGMISSAHDTAEGGLAIALAEAAIVGEVGATIHLPWMPTIGHLFGEAQSRVVVSVPPSRAQEFEHLCQTEDVPCIQIGITGGDRLNIDNVGSWQREELRATWESALPRLFDLPAVVSR